MAESGQSVPLVIPEDVMRVRLEQSEQMREFFVQMWLQNLAHAAQGGPRVRELLTALPVVPPRG